MVNGITLSPQDSNGSDCFCPLPYVVILQMLMGGWTTKVLSEVTRLGVPDVLHQHGPLTSAEVIQRGSIRADPRALQRALRACAALGVFGEDPAGRFSPTHER